MAMIEGTPAVSPELARGAGEGKILFLDTPSGIAGDMLVAALLDLGVPGSVLTEALSALPFDGYRLETRTESRSGIAARRFIVHAEGAQHSRNYRDIRGWLETASLDPAVRDGALRAFHRLAEAEAKVHGRLVDEVHFHEVGAVDSIVDIVSTAAAMAYLGARVLCSPLPMGRGFVKADHGVLPLPAPATVYCLEGAPTYDAGVDAELVTPTGATLVRTFTSAFTRWPSMRPERIGWGAGTRTLADRPNLLRLVLGSPNAAEENLGGHERSVQEGSIREGSVQERSVLELSVNLDDMSGELASHAVDRLMEAGALDAWTTAIGMKKGRPAIQIRALVRPECREAATRVLLTETTTLGVRWHAQRRVERPRRVLEVRTPFGPIPVKIADGDGLPPNVAPEFDACRRLASDRKVPVKEVYDAALEAGRLKTTSGTA